MEFEELMALMGAIIILTFCFTLLATIWVMLGPLIAIWILFCSFMPVIGSYYCWFYKRDSPIGTCPSCHGTLYLHHREISLFPPKVRIYGACPKCEKIIEVEKS